MARDNSMADKAAKGVILKETAMSRLATVLPKQTRVTDVYRKRN